MSMKRKNARADYLSAVLLVIAVLIPLEGLFRLPSSWSLCGHRLGRSVARRTQHRPRAGI